MKLRVFLAITLLFAAGAGCRAKTQESVKEDVKTDTQKAKNGIETGAKKAGEGVEIGVKKTGEGIGIGLEKAGQGLQRAGDAVTGKRRTDGGAPDASSNADGG
ncbi:MAG TPA: hypothetical protein VNO21_15135 [Polyangiaceae bacterium]|nr:hypothetical protein [Polyangiaceae bacterium]